MHEHKTSQDHLRDVSNNELTLQDRKRDLRSCTNIVGEVKVYTRRSQDRVLKVPQPVRLRARSHVRFVDVSSTPSVQRGSRRRDPPETSTPLLLSV
jgi:hypothetical protein